MYSVTTGSRRRILQCCCQELRLKKSNHKDFAIAELNEESKLAAEAAPPGTAYEWLQQMLQTELDCQSDPRQGLNDG